VDEWPWSPLAVGEVSCGPDGEEAGALSTPLMILGVGLKHPLQFPLQLLSAKTHQQALIGNTRAGGAEPLYEALQLERDLMLRFVGCAT
jgi:hypothetical protein